MAKSYLTHSDTLKPLLNKDLCDRVVSDGVRMCQKQKIFLTHSDTFLSPFSPESIENIEKMMVSDVSETKKRFSLEKNFFTQFFYDGSN